LNLYIGIFIDIKELNMRTFTRFTSIVFIALASLSYTANATLILEWNSSSVSSNDPATGVSATATLNFINDIDFLTNGLVEIQMLIRNTTGEITPYGEGATTSKLTGVAFDLIEPNSGLDQGNFTAGDYFDTMIADAPLAPFGVLDFGVADNDNFLGGNASDALPEGMEDSLNVLIGFNGLDSFAVEAAFAAGFADGSLNYVARFMQVEGGGNDDGSDKLSGNLCTENCDGGGGGGGGSNQEIPEPSILFLLGGGLLALSLRKKIG
jgi:hypothetical protein